jgi:hypothetical protein
MSEFSIELTHQESIVANEPVVSGRIKIGVFEEAFCCPITYWDGQRYVRQWRAALRRLIDGESKSALVTSVRDPKVANFLFWWVAFLDGNEIVIQNHVLFLEELTVPFDVNNLYAYVPEMAPVEPGEPPPSEWRTNVREIEKFLNRRSELINKN